MSFFFQRTVYKTSGSLEAAVHLKQSDLIAVNYTVYSQHSPVSGLFYFVAEFRTQLLEFADVRTVYLVFWCIGKPGNSFVFNKISSSIHEFARFFKTVDRLVIHTHNLYGTWGKQHAIVEYYRMHVYRHVLFSVDRQQIFRFCVEYLPEFAFVLCSHDICSVAAACDHFLHDKLASVIYIDAKSLAKFFIFTLVIVDNEYFQQTFATSHSCKFFMEQFFIIEIYGTACTVYTYAIISYLIAEHFFVPCRIFYPDVVIRILIVEIKFSFGILLCHSANGIENKFILFLAYSVVIHSVTSIAVA